MAVNFSVRSGLLQSAVHQCKSVSKLPASSRNFMAILRSDPNPLTLRALRKVPFHAQPNCWRLVLSFQIFVMCRMRVPSNCIA
jgi:hypothetical protein